jgi:small neutral amino acid transporter SnatA (MarC family)
MIAVMNGHNHDYDYDEYEKIVVLVMLLMTMMIMEMMMIIKHLLVRNIQQFPSEIFNRLMLCMTVTIAT